MSVIMFLAIEAVLLVTDENLGKNIFDIWEDFGKAGILGIKIVLITRWYRQEVQTPRMCWDND